MTLKTYHEPDGSKLIDGSEKEVGGEPRKLGLLLPKSPPKLFVRLGDAMPLLDEPELRKILGDPSRKMGRNRFLEDWIKDQDSRGACNGYAKAAANERSREIRGLPRVPLSGDFAYCLMNGGSDSGSHLAEGMAKLQTDGDCPEELVNKHGLRWEYRKSRFPQECFAEAKRFLGREPFRLETEQELLTALARDFPCVVAVHVSGSGSLDRYGVIGWGNGSGNHSVCCDDAVYDTQLGQWKFDIPNSWKVTFGDRGRCFTTWKGQLSRPASVHTFYAIPSTIDDPQGDNPPTPKGN